MTEEEKQDKDKLLRAVAKRLANLLGKDFDSGLDAVMEEITPLARQFHAASRLDKKILIPLHEALKGKTTASDLLDAITTSKEAIALLNRLHEDRCKPIPPQETETEQTKTKTEDED